jgi:competence protein ComEC
LSIALLPFANFKTYLPFMFYWTPFPLVRIATVFTAGILLGIYQFGIITSEVAFGLAAAFMLLYLITFLFISKFRNLKYPAGFFGFAVLFLCGYMLVGEKTESNKPSNILYSSKPILAYQGVVEGHLDERKSSFKTTVVVKAIKTEQGWSTASGKVNLYISRKTYKHNLQWGDRVIIKGSPQVVSPPGNPHEFDFKRFLAFRNIYHQHFVRGDALTRTGQTEKGFFHYSSLARNYFSDIIKKYVDGEQEEAISLALVIGVTDGIDDELISAYSASGAMHVLAVSGLHVGIIYWMILLLLKPLQKNPSGQWFVAVVSLLILWSYSFVTGLSPSVLRAVTMFSFMALAKPLNVRSNIFNTLAASAFILLLYDPYLIMSVGFQLSYLAVLGIIWIQRPLYMLYEAKSWLADQIWNITCVSIAAQATTFSLGLLYFHQFPTYFLFSNLFVIPVSFVVLVAGIVLLLVNVIEPLANLVGWVLHWSSWLLNQSVFVVEDLPLSIISDIYIDAFQSWLIMGVLASLIFLFQYKNIRWLYASVALTCVLGGARWMHYWERNSEAQLFVYSVAGRSAFEIVDKGKSIFLTDSALLADQERVRFHIRPNRLFNMVKDVDVCSMPMGNDTKNYQIVEYGGRSILYLHQPIKAFSSKTNPDFVVMAKGAAWSSPEVIARFPNSRIILDSSWGIGQVRWLRKQMKAKEDMFYSVTERGAFVVKL